MSCPNLNSDSMESIASGDSGIKDEDDGNKDDKVEEGIHPRAKA